MAVRDDIDEVHLSSSIHVLPIALLFRRKSQTCLGYPPQQDLLSNCDEGKFVEYTFFAENKETYFVHVRGHWYGGAGSNFNIVYTESEEDPVIPTPSQESDELEDSVDSGAAALSFVVAGASSLLASFWL